MKNPTFGYKVIRGIDRRSAIVNTLVARRGYCFEGVAYPAYGLALPPPYSGPLAVFTNKKSAERWCRVNTRYATQDLIVVRCVYEPAPDSAYVLGLYYQSVAVRWDLSLPVGTVLASAVICLE